MRRKDREVTDTARILELIRRCEVCRVAMFDETYPYIVPMNFGMSREGEPLALYFHCAPAGKKLELMQRNGLVSFEMDCTRRLVTGARACDTSMEYESVCGCGHLERCGAQEKEYGLARIMAHYCGEKAYAFDRAVLEKTVVLRLAVHAVTSKTNIG